LYVLLNPDPEPQLNQNGVKGWDASKKKYCKKNIIKKINNCALYTSFNITNKLRKKML